VALPANEQYQAFPAKVSFVADHAKRAIASYPIARGRYYGVDYSPGTDISWYKNIPVPTSYMVTESKYDFSGGYDHAYGAGWTDYSVAADVHSLSEAPAVVMAHIDSAGVFCDGKALWPSGYVLRFKPDGAWELLSAKFKKPVVTLASGTVLIDPHG
jgi:hypothetical protein